METDGAMRLVMSPEEAKSLIRYYRKTEQELPKWAVDYDGESCVWLEEEDTQ